MVPILDPSRDFPGNALGRRDIPAAGTAFPRTLQALFTGW
jgi:hypothetical protein